MASGVYVVVYPPFSLCMPRKGTYPLNPTVLGPMVRESGTIWNQLNKFYSGSSAIFVSSAHALGNPPDIIRNAMFTPHDLLGILVYDCFQLTDHAGSGVAWHERASRMIINKYDFINKSVPRAAQSRASRGTPWSGVGVVLGEYSVLPPGSADIGTWNSL